MDYEGDEIELALTQKEENEKKGPDPDEVLRNYRKKQSSKAPKSGIKMLSMNEAVEYQNRRPEPILIKRATPKNSKQVKTKSSLKNPESPAKSKVKRGSFSESDNELEESPKKERSVGIFHDLKFFIAETPERDALVSLVRKHGGSVLNSYRDEDTIVLVDPTTKTLIPDAKNYDTKFARDCAKENLLLDLDDYRVEKDSAKKRKRRKKFTEDEDKLLCSLVDEFKPNIGGNIFYQEIEDQFPDRTWQSLRERYYNILGPRRGHHVRRSGKGGESTDDNEMRSQVKKRSKASRVEESDEEEILHQAENGEEVQLSGIKPFPQPKHPLARVPLWMKEGVDELAQTFNTDELFVVQALYVANGNWKAARQFLLDDRDEENRPNLFSQRDDYIIVEQLEQRREYKFLRNYEYKDSDEFSDLYNSLEEMVAVRGKEIVRARMRFLVDMEMQLQKELDAMIAEEDPSLFEYVTSGEI